MDPKPKDVLEKATSVTVVNPEQAMIMLQTLGRFWFQVINYTIQYIYLYSASN